MGEADWRCWRPIAALGPRAGPERHPLETGEAVGQVVRPRPAGRDAQDVSPSVADEDASGVEEGVVS
jgi:hypothetical protein